MKTLQADVFQIVNNQDKFESGLLELTFATALEGRSSA